MIIVLGYLDVDPAALGELQPAFAQQMAESLKEDGCERYSLAVENAETGRVSISERWRDGEALKAHGAAPHMQAFSAALKGKVRGADIKAYDAENERKLG